MELHGFEMVLWVFCVGVTLQHGPKLICSGTGGTAVRTI